MDWQRRFRAGAAVYEVVYSGDGESTGRFFDSEEAAKVCVDFYERHQVGQNRRVRVVKHNIHTLDLARERYGCSS